MQVRLGIFSGVPDPQWTLDETSRIQLQERLRNLLNRSHSPRVAIPEVLGYHGLTILPEADEWPMQTVHVYGGRVFFENENLEAQDNTFEYWLLKTANNLKPSIREEIETQIQRRLREPPRKSR